MKMDTLTPKKTIFELMQRDFAFPLKDRLHIVAETEKYKWREDESVWKQKKDKAPLQYEAYFDGEFVCFFGTQMTELEAYCEVLKGIRELYKSGKIHWNKELYEFDKKPVEEIVLDAPDSPEDYILTEVVKKHAKKSGKKVKLQKRFKNVTAN